MRLAINVIIGLVLIGVSLFFGYRIIQSKTKPEKKVQKIVKTALVDTVRNHDVKIQIPTNGIITAKNRVELFTEVSGVFTKSSQPFKPGQAYGSGALLIQLDASEYYSSVQAAKSEFYNLITSLLPDLRLDYPNVFEKWQSYLATLAVDKSLPKLPEVADDKERYFITGRGVYSSFYNIKNLEERLAKYYIRAPFSGILVEANVTRGTLVRVGQKLGTFIDPSVYEMEIAVNKSYSSFLKVGNTVELANTDTAKKYSGTVSRINGAVDTSTQTIRAFVEVKGQDLKEGMYLTANLEAQRIANAIEIDRTLLQNNSQLFQVKDSVLHLIPAQPVYLSETKAVVTDIPENTILLSKPIPGAYEGMRVSILQE